MNRKKLLGSNWTAVNPKNKEKHFTVTQVKLKTEDPQVIDFIILLAVYTNKSYKVDYKVLENEENWKQGWE